MTSPLRVRVRGAGRRGRVRAKKEEEGGAITC